MGSRSVVILMSLAVVAVSLPATAAEDATALNKIVELNRKALLHFERKEFDAAKDTLLEAVVIGKNAGLGTHNLIARTYIHLGALYVDGLQDTARGVRYLTMAMKLRPDINLTPSLATPTLRQAYAAAQAEVSGEPAPASPRPVKLAPPPPPPPPEPRVAEAPPKPAAKVEPKPAPKAEPKGEAPPPPAPAPIADASGGTSAEKPKPKPKKKRRGSEEPDLPANIPTPLYCPNPDEAPPNEKIALRCVTKPGLQVARVLLFYRKPGDEQFTAVPTVRSPKGWYHAPIPGDAAVGKSLQYYFEARDRADKVSGHVGRSDSPNLMIIREGAPVVGKGTLAMVRLDSDDEEGDLEEEEDPLAGLREERERLARASEDDRRRPGAIWVALGIGSGYGWHGKSRLEYRTDLNVDPGMSPSGLFHLAPEVGYQLSKAWAVSLQGRNQFIPSEGSGDLGEGDPATGAHAVLARGIRYFGEGNTQWQLSAALGGGDGFRLGVSPRGEMLVRNDTVRGGPILAGAGLGLTHHFSPRLAATGELCGLAGVPTFAVVADLRVGVQLAF